jgi:parvulin-like peptidyl-prolyl isomerase
MSASDKKRLRKEQNAAAMTEKQRQAQKEAKSLKAYTLTFVVVMALVVAMVLGIALRSPVESLINQNTHAVTIGTHELTIPEFSYFFVDEINAYYYNLYSYYGSYAQYFLGFTAGKSLNDQVYDKETGETWAKHFMNEAAKSAQEMFGLYDLALKNNHEMTEEEVSALDAQISGMKDAAKSYGYNSVNAYLKGMYGNGASQKTYEKYASVSAMASSYYDKHSEELKDSYTDETFSKYEEDKVGEYYSYSYLLYQINTSTYLGEGTKGEDGKVTYTDEQKAAALEAAKADVQKLLDAGIIDEETFNSALLLIQKDATSDKKEEPKDESTDSTEGTEATEGTEGTESTESTSSTEATKPKEDDKKEENKKDIPLCTVGEDVLFSSLNATLQDWVTGKDCVTDKVVSVEIKTEKPHEHKEGEEHSDDEEVEYEVTGFYVVLLQDINKNDMKLVNVRHILINLAELSKDATTDQKDKADADAKAEAERILKEWKDGKADAESFGELANKYSKDSGSNTNGGLYEDVYPGWSVKEFNAWCFDAERKAGDSGIVKTDNGYHVMYLEGFGEYTYRNYMIMNDKLTEDLEAYLDEIVKATAYTEVNLSRMNWDITFG